MCALKVQIRVNITTKIYTANTATQRSEESSQVRVSGTLLVGWYNATTMLVGAVAVAVAVVVVIVVVVYLQTRTT